MVDNESIQKLKDKSNVSYEDAKIALEESNGDILDAIVFLEENGKINKPKTSVYYSNEVKNNYEIINTKVNDSRTSRREGFFESICGIIDRCNNIFFQIKSNERVLIKLPLTVMILLIIFAFWMVVPIFIVLLFKGLEFSVVGQNIEKSKINSILDKLSDLAQNLRKDSKKK